MIKNCQNPNINIYAIIDNRDFDIIHFVAQPLLGQYTSYCTVSLMICPVR